MESCGTISGQASFSSSLNCLVYGFKSIPCFSFCSRNGDNIAKIKRLRDSLHDRRDEHGVHLGDGAILTSQVFHGRAEVVEFGAVENEKSIVK